MLDRYNSPSVDGPWYVFARRARGRHIHARPRHTPRACRPDATSVRTRSRLLDFARTPRAGHWVDYVFLNPETGQEELKHTWIVRRGDYLFGSGWYEEAE